MNDNDNPRYEYELFRFPTSVPLRAFLEQVQRIDFQPFEETILINQILDQYYYINTYPKPEFSCVFPNLSQFRRRDDSSTQFLITAAQTLYLEITKILNQYGLKSGYWVCDGVIANDIVLRKLSERENDDHEI